jgi:hypothetical protein
MLEANPVRRFRWTNSRPVLSLFNFLTGLSHNKKLRSATTDSVDQVITALDSSTDIMCSNSAQGMSLCPRLPLLYFRVQIKTLNQADTVSWCPVRCPGIRSFRRHSGSKHKLLCDSRKIEKNRDYNK